MRYTIGLAHPRRILAAIAAAAVMLGAGTALAHRHTHLAAAPGPGASAGTPAVRDPPVGERDPRSDLMFDPLTHTYISG